jgi:hypothetical protein
MLRPTSQVGQGVMFAPGVRAGHAACRDWRRDWCRAGIRTCGTCGVLVSGCVCACRYLGGPRCTKRPASSMKLSLLTEAESMGGPWPLSPFKLPGGLDVTGGLLDAAFPFAYRHVVMVVKDFGMLPPVPVVLK